MTSLRLPRFTRAPTNTPLQLTERDCEIIRLVDRHRFLRSPQVLALIGAESSQHLLRRLQLLYHHGYLERPRAQLDYYHQGGGSRHIVYGLGNEGAALLKIEGGAAVRKSRWSEKNRAVGRIFLEHALLVSDIMLAIELACRKDGSIRLLTERELSGKDNRPFKWEVTIQGRKCGVLPDRVFALEWTNEHGKTERAFFFLEADRGTMPVIREKLLQTSFYRKLLAYEATWKQSVHRTRFGFHRFRVLTVTTSAARVKSLLEACSGLKQGRGLFLFADKDAITGSKGILSSVWQTCRRSETESLL